VCQLCTGRQVSACRLVCQLCRDRRVNLQVDDCVQVYRLTTVSTGRRVCVGYADGTVKLLDLKSGASVFSLAAGKCGHDDEVTCVDCHHNDNLIITGSVDCTALVINVGTGKVTTRPRLFPLTVIMYLSLSVSTSLCHVTVLWMYHCLSLRLSVCLAVCLQYYQKSYG